MGRIWIVLVLGGAVSACGAAGGGGIHEFARYAVDLEVTDFPDLNTSAPSRELMFRFNGDDAGTQSQCAWFGDATATFAGQPVPVTSPGGWDTYDIPTNTAPGQVIHAASCEQPFIDLEFMNPVGEPQNGVLAIDGAGAHFEVTYQQDFGAPVVSLVSATSSSIVVALQGFAKPPTVGQVVIWVWVQKIDGSMQAVVLSNSALSPDGQLTAAIPPGTYRGATSTSAHVTVQLGEDDVLPCQGFARCTATSEVDRDIEVDLPAP